MTQFLGGYLSDRVGGDVVLPIAACCWSLVTFWTPQLAYISDDKFLTLRIIIFSRVLLGVFQGKCELKPSFYSYKLPHLLFKTCFSTVINLNSLKLKHFLIDFKLLNISKVLRQML
jgi:hypothetical protein